MRFSFKFSRMWIFHWIKFSWNSWSMWKELGWLKWLPFFFARGYLPLIWKDSVVHIHAPAVYVKLPLPVAGDLSLENFASFYSSFCLALLHSVSSFFFLYWSPCLYLWSKKNSDLVWSKKNSEWHKHSNWLHRQFWNGDKKVNDGGH